MDRVGAFDGKRAAGIIVPEGRQRTKDEDDGPPSAVCRLARSRQRTTPSGIFTTSGENGASSAAQTPRLYGPNGVQWLTGGGGASAFGDGAAF